MRGCLSLAQGFRPPPPSGDLAFQGSALGHSGRAGGQHTLHGQGRALRTALFLSPRPVALSPFSRMSLAISAKSPQGWAQTLSSMGTPQVCGLGQKGMEGTSRLHLEAKGVDPTKLPHSHPRVSSRHEHLLQSPNQGPASQPQNFRVCVQGWLEQFPQAGGFNHQT